MTVPALTAADDSAPRVRIVADVTSYLAAIEHVLEPSLREIDREDDRA